MVKILSGRVRSFNVGISSSTENETALSVTGITSTRGLTVTNSATINGLTYPTSDGSNFQVLTTDGSGNLSFQTVISAFDWAINSDLGSITGSVGTESDSGAITDSVTDSYNLEFLYLSGLLYPTQFILPSYTVSTLPSASVPGQMLFVTDETGGSIPAFSDGTNWRRITDGIIVS